MNKHLIAFGIVVLLLAVGLSGCTNQNPATKTQPKQQEDDYFTLSGKITNNYDSNSYFAPFFYNLFLFSTNSPFSLIYVNIKAR